MVNYKTIKISEATYDAIIRAQDELADAGFNAVPKEILEKCTCNKEFTIGAVVELGNIAFNQMLNKIKNNKKCKG